MKKYVSIDIGGTAIKYGLVNEKGEILESSQMKTEAHKGGPSILEKAVKIVENYVQRETICGICISTAGMVDVEKGEIFYSAPLIPNYAGTKFKETMETKFRIPCEVENDVNCAGLAEHASGAAMGSKASLMLTIGTGIGGCMILNGEVYHGFSGSACEVGYMHMDGSDFQTLGAASILSKKVTEWKRAEKAGKTDGIQGSFCENGKNQKMAEIHENERCQTEEWSGYRIFQEAKKGDELCIRAIDEMADVLGKGIANICYVINPEIVVLGGGIMAQEEYLKERIEKAVVRYLVPSIAEHTKIAFAKHQNHAGMLGAFYHFRNRTAANVVLGE